MIKRIAIITGQTHKEDVAPSSALPSAANCVTAASQSVSHQKDAARYNINPDIDQLLKGSAAGGLEVNEAHTRVNESPRAVTLKPCSSFCSATHKHT